MSKRPPYPFEPRSNSYLEPGQFWAVPLSDGRFACGRVLGVLDGSDPFLGGNTRMFFAALMDWVGPEPPRKADLAGSQVIDQGGAHIRTIRETGRVVLGCRPLELDGVVGLMEVTHRGGGTVYLYEGPRRVRSATRAEARDLPVHPTWGFKVIEIVAERVFVQGKPVAR